MKKFTLLSTLFIIAAFALAACTSTPASIPATGSNGSVTPAGASTSATTGTPAAASSPSVTGTANATSGGTGASSTETPSAATTTTSAAPATTSTQPAATGTSSSSSSTVPTSAASATSPATGQATATTSASGGTTGQSTATSPASSTAGTTTATAPAATAAATGTSSAGASNGTGTQQAGVNQAQFLRLSNLMNLTVQTSDMQQVGAVNSVIVDRPSASANSAANNSTVSTTAPVVRYVVVTLNSMITSQGSNGSNNTGATGSQVIVPFQAFNFNNLIVGQGSTNQTASTSTLTMNVGMSVLSGAPRVDVAQAQNGTSNTWESQVSQYWTSQGLNIPTTGTTAGQTSSLVFIGKQMNGFNVVGANNAILGQVADFLVDVHTGVIAYAVITPQGMNGQSFFIPLSSMTWQFPVGQNNMTTLGNLLVNITPSILQNAPSLGSLNNLQINPSVLQQLNLFWQSIQSTPVK